MWFSISSFRVKFRSTHTLFFFFICPRYYYRCTGIFVVFCVFATSHCTTIRLHVYTSTSKAYSPKRFETGESSLLVHRFSARRGKEERRFHGTLVSKVADTGRGGGSRALVAWLDRHAALPRDTLLKQRTTLKFSESTGCVCKGNKSWLLEMRGIVACLEILNFGIY